MRSSWIFVIVAAFAAGFGVAWWAKPGDRPANPENFGGKQPSLLQVRSGSQGPSREPQRYESNLAEMRKDPYNRDMLREQLDELGHEKIPEVLAALSETAGLHGLSSDDKSLLKRILAIWYEDDADAALAWVLALENEKDRLTFVRDFVELEGKEDLDRALVLLDTLSEQGVVPRVPVNVLQKAADHDAETLMRACRAGFGEGNSAGGYTLQFSDDFDFEVMLNGLAEAVASAPRGHLFSGLPSNLLMEWAKRDSQAALDWTFLKKNVPFNSGVEEFLDGYREVASDAEVGIFVADLQKARGNYAESWAILRPLENEGIVRQFLESASDFGTPEEHLGGLIRESMRHVGDNPTQTMLLSMMDAESRYRLFTSDEGIPNLHGSQDALRPVLLRLGHSPAEVEQMLQNSR